VTKGSVTLGLHAPYLSCGHYASPRCMCIMYVLCCNRADQDMKAGHLRASGNEHFKAGRLEAALKASSVARPALLF
jgi:hypothetical protein